MSKRLEWAPNKIAEVSSVGVLIHTTELYQSVYGRKPHFLFVQQADQPTQPWGIPAGRVEKDDETAKDTAVREVKEETGLEISQDKLELFAWWEKGPYPAAEPIQVVYSYEFSLEEFFLIGNWEVFAPQPPWVVMGRSYPMEDIYLLKDNPLNPKRSEISAMALIPAMRMFERGNSIAGHPYRWDSIHNIKQRLHSLRIF